MICIRTLTLPTVVLSSLGFAIGVAAAAETPEARLQVRVEVAAALADRVEPDHTLYVFARALEGPAMPLAAVRTEARELPGTFVLDDSSGSMSALRLSQLAEVEVVARISKSGNATSSDGDLEGVLAPVKVGPDAHARVIIDTVISGVGSPHTAAPGAVHSAAPEAADAAHPQRHTPPRLELGREVNEKWKSVILAVMVAADGDEEIQVDVGDSAPLQATGARVEVLSFVPAFKTDQGVVTTASNEPTNPAVLVRMTASDGAVAEGWIFQKYPQFNTFKVEGLEMRLLDAVVH